MSQGKRIAEQLKRNVRQQVSNVLHDIALEARRLNLLRLSRGVGLHGVMPSYSHSYKKIRAQSGRQSRVRDLDLTGEMIRSFQVVKVHDLRYELRFRSNYQRLKAKHNQFRSPWLGLTTQEKLQLIGYASQRLRGQ